MGQRVVQILMGIGIGLGGLACDAAEVSNPEEAPEKPSEENADGFEQEYTLGGAPVKVVVKLSRTQLTIAQKTTLTLELYESGGAKADFPNFTDASFGGLGIRDISTETRLEGEDLVQVREYELTPIVSEEYQIQPFEVPFYTADQVEAMSAASDDEAEAAKPIPAMISVDNIPPIVVESILGEDIPDPIGIQPGIVMKYPFQWQWWHFSLMGGAVLMALIGLGILIYLRNRKPVIPPTPAHVVAFEALRKLRESQVYESEGAKAFYYAITMILREYIEDRFKIRAAEQTTEEFFRELQTSNWFGEQQVQTLEAFIRHCDLVKFAGEDATAEQVEKTFQLVSQFIDQTAEKTEVAA